MSSPALLQPRLHSQIAEIFNNVKLQQYASGQGLQILRTAWEDTGRSKNSCWGPNISDMTLSVEGTRMPIIRQPNFEDVSADLAIEKFNVTVGNETGSKPHRIPLKQYINEIGKWTGAPGLKNYLLERDSRILTSAQCCVLPLRDGKVEFAVELYNYQGRVDDPAVLVIVASTAGTSAQVLDRKGKVLFQKKDRALNYMISRSQDFVVERVAELKKERPNEAVEVLEKEARAEALERGCVQIFQIPLKQRPRPVYRGVMSEEAAIDGLIFFQAHGKIFDAQGKVGHSVLFQKQGKLLNNPSAAVQSMEYLVIEQSAVLDCPPPAAACAQVESGGDSGNKKSGGGGMMNSLKNFFSSSSSSGPSSSKKPAAAAAASASVSSRSPAISSSSPPARGIDAGVVQEGSDAGPWSGIPAGAAWERDERFPIRATIQFYTVTDTLDISEQVFREFAGKIRDVFSYGSHQGSLVTATSNRVTEPGLPQPPSAEVLAASPIGPWAAAHP
jgi:hypothetical protein